MPIDFRCPQCNKLLRTPDGSAGKHAKCPQCGLEVVIPAPVAAVPAGRAGNPLRSPAVPTPDVDAGCEYQLRGAPNIPPPISAGHGQPGMRAEGAADNPFQASQVMSVGLADELGFEGHHRLEMVFTKIDPIDVLRRTWNIFKKRFVECVVAFLVVLLATFILYLLILAVGIVFAIVVDPGLAILLGVLVMIPLPYYLMAGVHRFHLNVARGYSGALGDLFSGGRYILPLLFGGLIFSILANLGFMLLVIPGIFVVLVLWPYALLIVDRNMDAISALGKAAEITKGNRISVFLVGLLCFVIALVVGLFTLGLGIVVIGPFVTLAMHVTYLMMTGQRLADEDIN